MRFSEFLSQSKKTFISAPIELKIFFFFSLLVSLIAFVIQIFCSKHFIESIIPITGWSLPISYPNCVIVCSALLFVPIKKNLIFVRNILIFLLLINIVAEAYQFLSLEKADFVNPNPYLRMSEWRPLWVFIIPSFWIFVLLSPRIKRYCTAAE
ncbi:MAG: hypothetical protein NTZ33_06725 [Bacteroidetes bacterium]|nr:hypothetical protein [Bacteroidota bacterium]